MHKRTKAVAITPKVRQEVEERDNHQCVFCHTTKNVRGEMHYIRRSQGGLGIPQNLLTGCRKCHAEFDEGKNKEYYRQKAKEYLQSIYPDWNEEDLVYNKWKEFKCQ